MAYTVNWEPRGVLRRYEAHLSQAEFIASFHELFDDERFDRVSYVIDDLAAVTTFDFELDIFQEIAELAATARHSNAGVRVFLVGNNSLVDHIHTHAMRPDKRTYDIECCATVAEARQLIRALPSLVLCADNAR